MSFINGTVAGFQGQNDTNQPGISASEGGASAIQSISTNLVGDDARITSTGTATLDLTAWNVVLNSVSSKPVSSGPTLTHLNVIVLHSSAGVSAPGTVIFDVDVSGLVPSIDQPIGAGYSMLGSSLAVTFYQALFTVTRVDATTIRIASDGALQALAQPFSTTSISIPLISDN